MVAFAAFGYIYVAVQDPNAGDTPVEGRGTEELPNKTLRAALAPLLMRIFRAARLPVGTGRRFGRAGKNGASGWRAQAGRGTLGRLSIVHEHENLLTRKRRSKDEAFAVSGCRSNDYRSGLCV